jgi:hypothetical protein
MPANRPWTVLAYIVADDSRTPPPGQPSLNEIAEAQIEELAKAAKETETLTLLHVDFTQQSPRRCVLPGAIGSSCTIQRESNAASPKSLRSFFAWAAEQVETRKIVNTRYAVFFWGHGAGPAGLFLDPTPSTTTPSLKIPDLARALGSLGRPYVDLVLFQDCWVSTLEIAYELKDNVRHMIASQGLIRPIRVIWPYGLLFEAIKAGDAPTHETLEKLVRHLTDAYAKLAPTLSFSALTLDAAASLAAPLQELTSALLDATGQELLDSRKILNAAVGGDRALIDVRTMCKALRKHVPALFHRRRSTSNASSIPSSSPTARSPVRPYRGEPVPQPPDDEIDDSVFAKSLSMRTYDQLALNKTGWSKVAFEESLQPA